MITILESSMQYHAASIKGKRKINQDFYTTITLNDHYFLFAVADGVGGLSDGEIASKLAITTLIKQLKEHLSLEKAMIQSHQQIMHENKKRDHPMATTLTACLLDTTSQKASFAHLGDSKAIVFNDTIWMTTDHTVVQELVELGIITDFQAKHHPERHRLKQAIGISSNPSFQFQTKSIQNITILLCTDGISDYVTLEKIQNIVTNHPAEHACTHLISKAKHHKSPDDMTAIVIQHK